MRARKRPRNSGHIRRQPVLLYADHGDFEQTNAVSGVPGEATGGVTEFLKRRVVLPMTGPFAETDHVLGHELVHAFELDLLYQIPGGSELQPEALPLWLMEGLAEFLSLGPMQSETRTWICDALARDALPDAEQIADPRYFPYRYGHAFWTFLASEAGDRVPGALLREVAHRRRVGAALESLLDRPVEKISERWRAFAEASCPAQQGESERTALERLEGPLNEGELHLGPALSPDGRLVASFIAPQRIGVELVIAEVETGRIVRRVVRAGLDPHFESLSFVRSSGAWSPDGRLFAFPTRTAGVATLALYDVERGRIRRELQLPAIGELLTPSWSPGGRHLAFTGLRGGFADLFVYDLERETLEPLTDDAYADLEPAWSPDGARLVFSTDRFSLDPVHFGGARYALATLTLASGAIEPLAALGPNADHHSPQWSAAGALYFVSDALGSAEVYRIDPGEPESAPRRVARAATAIRGLTPLSPALSVAASAPLLVASVFEDQGTALYALRGAERLRGTPLRSEELAARPAPPEGEIAALLRSPELGWPEEAPEERAYQPWPSLDRVGTPALTAGASREGSFAVGGASLLFSDMLGDHVIGAGLQVSSELSDLAGLLAYENRTGRASWGLAFEQVPYVTHRYSVGIESGTGDLIERVERLEEVQRVATAVLSYPFSRALRGELLGSYTHLSYQREIEVQRYSFATGQLLEESDGGDAPDSLSLTRAGAALVFDNALHGPTSPVAGTRWRLEASSVRGSLAYQEALLDLRHYVELWGPFTLAFRALHFGRYGGDAEDPRLSPLFLGYANLVRGYERDSFEADECEPDANSECPAYDRLLGSRILVGNAELRFPLLGYERARRLPIEAALFSDVGWAWTRDRDPSFLGGARDPVFSYGAALRIGLFGTGAVFELAAAHPHDRPDSHWQLIFTLRTGL